MGLAALAVDLDRTVDRGQRCVKAPAVSRFLTLHDEEARRHEAVLRAHADELEGFVEASLSLVGAPDDAIGIGKLDGGAALEIAHRLVPIGLFAQAGGDHGGQLAQLHHLAGIVVAQRPAALEQRLEGGQAAQVMGQLAEAGDALGLEDGQNLAHLLRFADGPRAVADDGSQRPVDGAVVGGVEVGAQARVRGVGKPGQEELGGFPGLPGLAFQADLSRRAAGQGCRVPAREE